MLKFSNTLIKRLAASYIQRISLSRTPNGEDFWNPTFKDTPPRQKSEVPQQEDVSTIENGLDIPKIPLDNVETRTLLYDPSNENGISPAFNAPRIPSEVRR